MGEETVLDFWQREAALPPGDSGRERLAEVSCVAVDDSGRVAGITTVFLRRSERLRTEMWNLREFVGIKTTT